MQLACPWSLPLHIIFPLLNDACLLHRSIFYLTLPPSSPATLDQTDGSHLILLCWGGASCVPVVWMGVGIGPATLHSTMPLDSTTRYEEALLQAQSDATHLHIPGVEVEDVSADGVPCAWHRGEASNPDRAILYLHGGGYVSCSLWTHRHVMSRISTTTKAAVLGVDYRLAPLHPFPCALEDATKAYSWLLKQGFHSWQVAVAGDSAGGGLAVALLLKIKQDNSEDALPSLLPSACVLFSPWVDLTIGGKSLLDNYETDRLFNPRRNSLRGSMQWLMAAKLKLQWKFVAKMYAQWPTRLDDPLVSPLYSNLAGLPPTMIHCTAEEMLLDDSLCLGDKMRQVGVKYLCCYDRRLM